jgi:MFS family permease
MVQPPVSPSRRSLLSLDWLNFFLADVRTGVGPFLAIYLATQHWNEQAVGIALTVGGLAGVLSHVPAGALVDATRSKRALIGALIVLVAAGAIGLASWPSAPLVVAIQAVLGIVGSALGPAVAAVTLGLVGHHGMAERVGRNSRFDAAGNLAAAAACGFVGYTISNQAIFWLAAALAAPALWALSRIRSSEISYTRARGAAEDKDGPPERLTRLIKDRRLVLFAGCAVLFHFANAAMLPLLGEMLAVGKERHASLLMSACVMVTQATVALLAPWVGKRAEIWGRKPLLVLGFSVLPARGLLYTLTASPFLLISFQLLDGIGVAIFGVVSLLVIADLTEGSGRFNFSQGAIGMAVGIGASLSNAMAGAVVHRFGYPAGFLSLGGIAVVAMAILWLAMPETRPTGPGGARPPEGTSRATVNGAGRATALQRRGILHSGEHPAA